MLWLNSKNILRAVLLLYCLAALPGLSGCGYGLAADVPTVLGDGEATLKITGVEQPTMYPWVVYTVRSAMRNELTSRHLAEWVDSGKAQYNMHIKINHFTMRSAVSSRADETLIYNGNVSMTVTIRQDEDNAEIWRNTINYSNQFDSDDDESAARSLFEQAVRRVADRMRNTF